MTDYKGDPIVLNVLPLITFVHPGPASYRYFYSKNKKKTHLRTIYSKPKMRVKVANRN